MGEVETMVQIAPGTCEKILKANGAFRVSREAAVELSGHLTNIANKIANKIVKTTEHADRKTVLIEDIKLTIVHEDNS